METIKDNVENKQYVFIFYTPNERKEFFRVYCNEKDALNLKAKIKGCLANKGGIVLGDSIERECIIPYGLLNKIYIIITVEYT